MEGLDGALEKLEELLGTLEQLDPSARDYVFELLGALDLLHRSALGRLSERLGAETVEELCGDPMVAWLFDAYTGEDGIDPAPDPSPADRDVLQIRRRPPRPEDG